MARRINVSQFRSKIRQLQAKQRQAVARYNEGVRKYNRALRDLKTALNRYNQEVRSYNSRRRLHQDRLRRELAKLKGQRSTAYPSFRTSAMHLTTSYRQLEEAGERRVLTSADKFFLDLAEREAANSVGVVNAILSEEPSSAEASVLQETVITDEIAVISEELDERWRGALFSLNPSNPEASRHFCSSSREIFSEILELSAPDEVVFSADPGCPRTERGNATRRGKIAYLLRQRGVELSEATIFADEDIGNIMELFDILNSGAHGRVGHFDLGALVAIKRRVEDGLVFLSRLAA